MSSVVVDKAKSQFFQLPLKHQAYHEWFNGFDWNQDLLDVFCHNMIGSWKMFNEKRIGIVLLLSHGTVSFESYFSVNGDFVVKNSKETSLIAQHQV